VNYETKVASHAYKKIVAMSDYIRNGLIESGVLADKVVVNPYFTEPVEAVKWTEGEKRILFIGRIVSSKGAHILISALSDILKRDSTVFVDIVGDGMMMEELRKLVAAAELNNKIVLHGWLPKAAINRLIGQSYLLVFPSIYPEAFGIVGIEAMMHGKPVVGFDVGGVSTWLRDGENGFLINRKDELEMAAKTQLLLNDRGLYNRMSFKATAMALKLFTPEVHIEKLVEVYQKALQEG
jgi:glycosyltransferase involved in cell wall biosynthesis